MKEKIVLAYSGGLDTSVAVQWLIDKGYDVVACCLDVGEGKDLDIVYKKALDMELLNVILLMQQKNLVMSM
ncbi:argininosuccinate synthase domain-containing protein [Staphylococcus aureus]|nr:argininosuccinate synthase [Staphylococcus aureus]WFO06070.1 argininosuccinate synthase [Staphylococcus aureus]